ncbi:MAG TPA: biotin--[acetyl-CoA-carboxylase] ligase [Polyangiales bacterium]|nr:biotin--[acetyl-CoA-carboxylase] ligase [Polyangiales bacterium]
MTLDPAALLRTERYGRSFVSLAETGSTNDAARTAALGGAPNGHVVSAEQQLQGRGSNGRAWSSPPGLDLFVSIVDRPAIALPQLPPLTLAVGLGVAQAVDALLRASPAQVKWPNDVLLHGKKCAGILVEASTSGVTVESLVIGIGLNVNRLEFEPELREIATSLRAERPGHAELDRAQVLAQLLASVEAQVDRFVALGPSVIVAELARRLALIGQRARCGDVFGVVLGVSPGGALLMRTETGVRELHAGRLLPA